MGANSHPLETHGYNVIVDQYLEGLHHPEKPQQVKKNGFAL